MKYRLISFFLIASCFHLCAQELPHSNEDIVPLKTFQRKMDSLQAIHEPQNGTARKTTASNYDTATFASRINSCWGAGLPTIEKLKVFDAYWGNVDSFYDSFTGLPMYNWDSIVNEMRTEISGGVSMGRFTGIIAQLQGYINDGHSHFIDADVLVTSSLYWGRPLIYGPSGSYGACVTTLDDSSAMVYTAIPGNSLGLAPGDRILGYNGIPWKQLIPILLKYQLPSILTPNSTDSASWHKYICSVLSNYLMFDTLNIEKCDGTLINLPTTAVEDAYIGNNFCSEQLEIPGIQKMTYTDYFTNDKTIASGIITGTGIGYVAMYDCSDMSGDSLLNAVRRLIEDSLAEGLIIDIRTNFGGGFPAFLPAFYYLSDGDFSWVGAAGRFSVTDRYNMNPMLFAPPLYGTTDPDPNFFDKKIALLVGPGAISAGDMMQIIYAHHPRLKIIGKPTAGAFGGFESISMPYPNFYCSRQSGDLYRAEENNFYLSHHNFPIDSAVWFERASVCNGIDNILETAIWWIKPELAVKDINNGQTTANIYPNPSGGNFNILLQSPVTTTAEITIYNVLGIEAARMTTAITAGENRLKTNFANIHLPTGTYTIAIRGKCLEPIVKKVMVIN